MPGTKRKQLSQEEYPINAQCAADMATFAERLSQVVKDQTEIGTLLYGNGKTGLKEQTAQNTRDIADLIEIIKKQNEAKVLADKEKEKLLAEAELQRKTDIRKWWIGLGLAIITGIFAIVTTVLGSETIINLITKTY